MIGILMKILLGVLVAVVLLVAAGFGYRAWRQHQIAAEAAITGPNGINEARFVRIGGQDQWITIRGQDRNNPVLLEIDGGPGAAGSPFIPSPWEKDFVVVDWDQPGAGKTFSKAGGVIDPGLAIDQVTRDGIELADFLRGHLHRKKVGIYASSWGTFVGIPMVKRRPDLFYAYVGTGEVVNERRGETLVYQQVLAKARSRGDQKAIKELTASGPPPYASDAAFRTQRKWAEAYETAPSNMSLISRMAFSPSYGLGDVRNWFAAFLASQDHFFGKDMKGPAMDVDHETLGPDFQLPVFVFQGDQDDYTPYAPVKAYMDWIHAPQKLLVTAHSAGHYAAITHAAELRQLMLEHVRPLGVAAG
jgi:pimeloyl-ACP methyl ester carboxylesterase